MPTKPRRGCITGGCPNLAIEGGVYCRECLKRKGIDPDKPQSYGERSAEVVESTSWYNSPRWRKLRTWYITTHPLCAECERHGRTTPARIVDHIIPVKNGGAKYDPDNLQSLCQRCHEIKSNEEGSRGFKKGKGKVYTY